MMNNQDGVHGEEKGKVMTKKCDLGKWRWERDADLTLADLVQRAKDRSRKQR